MIESIHESTIEELIAHTQEEINIHFSILDEIDEQVQKLAIMKCNQEQLIKEKTKELRRHKRALRKYERENLYE